MYSLSKRNGDLEESSAKLTPVVKRRQLRPLIFHMGPVPLSIASVLLIGLMAVLYLSQLNQAVVVNQRIQDMRSEQLRLERENQDLQAKIAQEQSPTTIEMQARKQGLIPSDPKKTWVIKVNDKLQPIPDLNQDNQP